MVKEVLEFNEKRGLLDNYNIDLEFRLLLEEVFELVYDDKKYIKEKVAEVLEVYKKNIISIEDGAFNLSLTGDLGVLNACVDMMYIAIGTMGKLIKSKNPDYTLEDIEKVIKSGMRVVCEANAKKGNKTNSEGKIIKEADFVEPITPICLEDIK